MTKFSSRAELLASGARTLSLEELDWVSGGSTASAHELDAEEITVTAPHRHDGGGGGVGVGSGNGGGGTNLAFAGFFATHGSYGSSPKLDDADLLMVADPDGDADADGIPNGTDIDPLHNKDGVTFKPDAKIANLIAEIKLVLPVLAEIARDLGLPAPVITSGNDGYRANGEPIHRADSLHYKNAAVDVRGNNITDAQLRAFDAAVSARLGPNYDAKAEFFKETQKDHLHVEYDPKQ